MPDNKNPFASEEITAPYSAEWEAKRRVAAAVRKISEVLVTSSPDLEDMHTFAEELERTADRFADTPRLYGRLEWIRTGEHGSYGQVSHELNSLAGFSNPLAPPVHTWIDGETAFGRCICNWAYEGPPGSVHGGFVAAIFDQFMGMAQSIGGQPGMTAYLNVNYHQRTPLNTELNLRGELVELAGRKTRMLGEMFAGQERTASCEVLFVEPRQGIYSLENPETSTGP